jgi:WhiB family redox-sensing transcriptional regulator
VNRTVVARPTNQRRAGDRPLGGVASLAWRGDAPCSQTDPEAFFPEPGSSTQPAKTVCGACPVRVECLEHALAKNELYGVWGGLSPQARAELRQKRAGVAARGAA